MSKHVFLGMSGGVDSSVSAILLKAQGYDVTGVYMKNWSKDLPGMKCPWAEDLADAKRVAVQLDLDFEVWDFEQEYKNRVVDYMLAEFQKGRTPNPDVICNEQIKFKLFYEKAMAHGADFIATGHYARVGDAEKGGWSSFLDSPRPTGSGRSEQTACNDRPARTGLEKNDEPPFSELSRRVLMRAKDENKDQTYFLYRMSDTATAHTLFPVGNLLKPDVKRFAAQHHLDVATKKESMGVCFVGEVGMKDFLREYLDAKPGEIREIETGKVLGYHDGAIFYTIGQRHGLYLGGGLPYYVVKKDLTENLVYVSRNLNHPALWTDQLQLEDLHLRNGLTLDEIKSTADLKVRLRHRSELISVKLMASKKDVIGQGNSHSFAEPSGVSRQIFDLATRGEDEAARPRNDRGRERRVLQKDVDYASATMLFSQPIKRPASGQSAVLYSGEVCLGGGIIA